MKSKKLSRIILIVCLGITMNNATAQRFYLVGGGTYGWIINYNDDKGSEYFNESNYLGYKGFYHYTFGFGISIPQSSNSHNIEFTYKKIGGIGKYRNWERPQFGEVRPGLIVGYPDYQEQGFFATSILVKYFYNLKVTDRLFVSLGVGDNYLIDYKIYNYLSSSNPPYGEMRGLNSSIREEKYLNRNNLSLNLGIEVKITKLVTLSLVYNKIPFGINRKVDAIMIRKYHPNLLSLMIKIFYE